MATPKYNFLEQVWPETDEAAESAGIEYTPYLTLDALLLNKGFLVLSLFMA
jgi:hypothetical protein